MTDKIDLYELLGVEKEDDLATIKKAYKRLAMKYHPDRNLENPEAAEEAFKPIALAWETLGDPVKRAAYDATGVTGINTIEAEGEQVFLSILLGIMQREGYRELDYIDRTRAQLSGSLRDGLKAIEQLQAEANNIASLSEKFKPTKEGAHNPIEHILREMVLEGAKRVEAANRQVEVIEHAVSVVNQFKFVGSAAGNPAELIGRLNSFSFNPGNTHGF